MSTPPRPNVQSDPLPAESTDPPIVARAERRDGHYEPAADHLVKVVHQVVPASIATEGPTDFSEHDGGPTPPVADVRVTPERPSVWEAGPADDAEA
jgi:hypothetical protein